MIDRRRLNALLLFLLAASCFAAACGPSEPERRYELRGRVVSVDKEGGRVTIAHEAIADYMPAMTMPFRVKDGWVLDAVREGSTVNADLVVAGKSSWLERVSVGSVTGTPSLPSRVEGATEPTPGAPAPPIALVDQNGRPVTLERFRGKTVAHTFIYTRCPLPDYCPLMTDNFARVERLLRERNAPIDATQLLSISIDPEFDTPEVMRGYGERVVDGRIPANWSFVTGDPAAVRRVAESYGLVYETENDQVLHTLRTAVIAPDGTLARVFRGNEWTPEDLYGAIVDASQASD
jgi:protein SCO1/2